MTKDTKGVRQVLDKLADLLICDEHVPEYWTVYLENADQELQEIMLGMLPEKKELSTDAMGEYTVTIDKIYVNAYNNALKDMKQNIRGGFNNG